MSKVSHETKETKKKRGWFRRNVLKIILILVAIGVLSIISKLPKKEKDTSVSEPAPVNVTVMDVVSENEFADTFDLPAVVEPNRIVTISAEVDGRIESIPIAEGCKVKTGDLLVQLNTDLLQPQYEMAVAQLERNEIEHQRMVNLVENDATAQSDLDNATTNLAVSKAQVAEIGARLERSRILSPTNGVLNETLVEEGEYIQPGMPVAEIVDNDTVKVVAEIPERDISFFKTGDKVCVYVDYQRKEKILTGTITFISELADQLTRSTRIEVTLPNKEKIMRSGQIVRVSLTRQVLDDVILIPLSSVIPMEDGYVVYVANSTQAKRCEVELGTIKQDKVQVISGLELGDKLIISGHRFVVPGQKINIVSEDK